MPAIASHLELNAMLNVRKTKASPKATKAATTVTKAQQETPEMDMNTAQAQNEPEAAAATLAGTSTGLPQNGEESVEVVSKKEAAHVETKEVSGIVEGIPLPPSGGGGRAKYPWADLKPGDAFFVPGGKTAAFHTMASAASKKHGHKYAVRRIEDGAMFGPEYAGIAGVGVWRTE